MIAFRVLALAATLVVSGHLLAGDCVDVEGADHPRIQRYAAACLIGYVVREFDSVTLPTGPAVARDGQWAVADSVETLEGRSTRLMYLAPFGRSSLEVFRNYQRSLEQQGLEVVFTCSAAECDDRDGARLQALVYPSDRAISGTTHAAFAFAYETRERRYLAARSPDGAFWVGLFVAEARQIYMTENQNRVAVHLDVIELEEMEQRMVDATLMARSIGESGSVTLENIYFEFASATLTGESEPAITETAVLLRDNPGLSLYVVGHTDSVGSYEANLTLSRQRAEAVVAALIERHGIAGARVVPAGVGPLAPVASNASEEGRARNRRVELVAR